MAYIGFESIFPKQCALQWQEWRFRGLYGCATLLTNQMVVMPFFGGMIAKSPAPEVGLGYQAKILQQLQGAIDSGNVYVGIFGANPGMDILSAYVVIALLKGGEDELALRGQSVPQIT